MKNDNNLFLYNKFTVNIIFEEFDKIHVLVNNAGVFHSRRIATEEGFEIHFGVNHLGKLVTN